METATTAKRPRGRPRLDAPPRAAVNVRLRPEVRAQLERDAQRAKRSVTKEISIRLDKSYIRDEMFGGSQLSSMFREMAAVALGVERQKKRGSLFDDFETFVFVRDVWQILVQRQMPRPADELLTEIGRNWDAVKAGAPQSSAQAAAREWLIHHAPRPPGMTLAHVLAGGSGAGITWDVGTGESVGNKPAETNETAATGEPDGPPEIPAMGSLAQATQHLSPSVLTSGSYASSVAVSPIGSLAMALEGLTPAQGSPRAAAQEISRLAGLLAEMMEGEAAGDATVSPVEPDNSIAAAHGK